jgi:hypothetical protein
MVQYSCYAAVVGALLSTEHAKMKNAPKSDQVTHFGAPRASNGKKMPSYLGRGTGEMGFGD